MEQAVVVADRLGAELAPLTERTCVALLPVAGKPLVVHTMEALAKAGVKRVLVLISPFADEVKEVLGDGARWGLRLTYALTRGEEHPATVLGRLSRFGRRPDGPFLALRGDVLFGFDLARWIAASEQLRAGFETSAMAPEALADDRQGPAAISVWARSGDRSAGCGLHRGAMLELDPLTWPPPLADADRPHAPFGAPVGVPVGQADGAELASSPPMLWNALPTGQLRPLQGLAAYHRANLDAVAGRLPGLLLPGREVAVGLRVGRGSRVSPRSLRQGVALVGARCRLAGDAVLRGEVVINDDVIVDQRARIRDSVILPHSYVGALVDVRNAILCGNTLIRVDSGAVLHVTDAYLLANLREATIAGGLGELLHRLLGLLALLASVPLWPLALWSTWRHRRRARASERLPAPWLHGVRLCGNRRESNAYGLRQRREFTAWQWGTPVPILRQLPALLAVVSGDLRLIGVRALTPAETDGLVEDWERIRERVPAGLVGPARLDMPADAPREEWLLGEAFYASRSRTRRNLVYLLRAVAALFQARSWRSPVDGVEEGG